MKMIIKRREQTQLSELEVGCPRGGSYFLLPDFYFVDTLVGGRRSLSIENSDTNDDDFVSTISCRDSIRHKQRSLKQNRASFQDGQSRILRTFSLDFKL